MQQYPLQMLCNLWVAVLQKQKKKVFGMVMFFSLPLKMCLIRHFALVPKNI